LELGSQGAESINARPVVMENVSFSVVGVKHASPKTATSVPPVADPGNIFV
jgi:hypothetical protein